MKLGRKFGLAAAGVAAVAMAAAPIPTMAEESTDTERPTTELVSPAANSLDDLQIEVTASDNQGLNRIVANLYKDGELLKSTQSSVPGGATEGTHTASVGGLVDGDYVLRYNASDLAGNISRTVNFPFTIDDNLRPTATLVTPTNSGPFQQLTIDVDASDNNGLSKIVANIYRDGVLVKSTQTGINGFKSGSHTATVSLSDGDYVVRYNAADLAGNISQTGNFPVTLDATPPRVTIKEGAPYTVYHGGKVANSYNVVSFTLFDAGQVDRVEINGVVTDLTNSTLSDVNFLKLDHFGVVEGENTMVVYDLAGNATTHTFNIK